MMGPHILNALHIFQVFAGPSDSNWMITHQLPSLPSSPAFKFVPLAWSVGISMEFEVYGCNFEGENIREYERFFSPILKKTLFD